MKKVGHGKAKTKKRSLSSSDRSGQEPDNSDHLKFLMHELQVYQAELETQNDELKSSQIEIIKERQRFQNLFDLSPVAYFVLDPFMIIQEFNESALRLLSADRRAISQKTFRKFIDEKDVVVFNSLLKDLVIKGDPQSCFLHMLTRKGSLVYVQIQVALITDPERGIKSYYAGALNITDKKLAEIQKREINERLQLALDASSAGTWEIQLGTGVVSMDDGALRIFGLKKGIFDGKFLTLLKLVHEEDRQRFDDVMRYALLNKTEVQEELRLNEGTKGARYVETRGHILETEPGNLIFLALVNDISRRKALEKEALALKLDQHKASIRTVIETQEQERNRISSALHDSLGQLLYGVSLKLQNVKSVTDASFNEAVELLATAIKETRNISFELAPGILMDYGLVPAVQEMIKRISVKSTELTTRLTGFEERLPVEKELFVYRIAQELVNNTIKHAQASKASLEIEKTGSEARITMTDNGSGFAQNFQARGGTGLSSIKGRIALYNGTLTLSKTKEKETKVIVTLFNLD